MNRTRMIEWLLLAAGFYLGCIVLRAYEIEPQVQVVLWKLGNVTIASYLGYWIDRRAFGRITANSTPVSQARRATVMAACILAVAMGL